MTRASLLALLMIGTACSAQPRQAAPAAMQGPQGPQPAGSNDPVPANAPRDPSIRNVPATTGRANLPKTPPPFAVAEIGRFDAPFAMAFLPGSGDLLVTEKVGRLMLRLADGRTFPASGVPVVAQGGQGGLLDVAIAPDFATSHAIYLSYAEPRPNGGSSLAPVAGRT